MEQEATLVEEVKGVQEDEEGEVDVADTVQPGRLYSYSSEDDEEDEENLVWEKRLRKRTRFVTRLEMSRRGERLDMGTFTPLCTSERLGRGGEVLLKRSRGDDWGGGRLLGKRRPGQEVEKRRRRASSEESTGRRKKERRGSQYGSMTSLGSDMLRLELLEEGEKVRARNIVSGCLVFQRTMGRLKQKSITLVQELEATRECVEDCCSGTERLRTEYQRLCEGTRDLISTLRSARTRMKQVMSEQ